MRGHQLLTTVLAIAMALPTVIHAQTTRNLKESVTNEVQIARGKAQLSRDQREIKAFEELLATMDGAKKTGALDEYRRLCAELRSAMQREYEQAERKVAQAGREVGQSRREARGERQEARATGSTHDRLQVGDDRRDLRDDRVDFRSVAWRMKRMRAIIGQTDALQAVGEGDTASMVRSQRMMGEFLELLRADLRAAVAELAEDKRERREDRRERRHDRNR